MMIFGRTAVADRPRRKRRWIPSGTLLVIVLVLVAWAFWLEPASYRVRTYRLELPHWSAELSGLRVAVLADLHTGSPFNGIGKLERIVKSTNDSKPDLILIAGDFVIQGVKGGRFVEPETIAQTLRGLSAPLGVYAVLGNHDWWLDHERVRRAVEGAGIPVLDDLAKELQFREAGFWLVGVSDYWEGNHDIQAVLRPLSDGKPVLLFTHNPDLFPEVPDRVSLTIAAHTHGGQVYIPVIGRLVVPSRYGQRFASGHIVEEGRHLFVNTGLGTSIIPVRFLVPPEISILELRPQGTTPTR
jgi:predicted MPP superfamily phosphohydrolase